MCFSQNRQRKSLRKKPGPGASQMRKAKILAFSVILSISDLSTYETCDKAIYRWFAAVFRRYIIFQSVTSLAEGSA